MIDGAGATTTTTPPVAVVDATTDAGQAPGSTAAGAAEGNVDATGARAALDRYLDALAANDYPTALALSRGALRSLTIVRWIVHTGNAERGGTTTSAYEERRFEVGAATSGEVTFRGQAQLTSVVSGPSGPSVSTTDTFSDIVVRHGPDGWLAAAATYNGTPVLTFPASTAALAGPVQVTLTGATAFGSSLAVVVQLVADGEHTVDVSDDALQIIDEEAPSTSTLVVGGQPGYIYLTYPRRDEQPTEWHATITVDGSPHAISLPF